MNKKKSNPYGIKTPTSIKEFRENLQKYYLCISNGNYEKIDENSLLVKDCGGIELNKISSFDEIYKISESIDQREENFLYSHKYKKETQKKQNDRMKKK